MAVPAVAFVGCTVNTRGVATPAAIVKAVLSTLSAPSLAVST